jgi:hypothetical protein
MPVRGVTWAYISATIRNYGDVFLAKGQTARRLPRRFAHQPRKAMVKPRRSGPPAWV